MLLYSTVMGSIGVLAPLSSREDVDFFSHLEMHLRQEAPPLAGRDHLAFRSAYWPVRNTVDGDLCSTYAAVSGGPVGGSKCVYPCAPRRPALIHMPRVRWTGTCAAPTRRRVSGRRVLHARRMCVSALFPFRAWYTAPLLSAYRLAQLAQVLAPCLGIHRAWTPGRVNMRVTNMPLHPSANTRAAPTPPGSTLQLPPKKQTMIAEAMDRTPGEILKKLEDIRNKIL